MEEHHLAPPLLDPHGVIGQIRQLRREGRQLVKVGGEQRPAAVDLMQMLDRRPGDRQPVEGRGAAPDLVEDHEGPRAGLVEDGRRLHHLDHEGRTPPGKVVGGAHAAEQAVDDADMGALRRHERTHLGEDGDQRVLPQKRALSRHVGPGDEPQPAVFLSVADREVAIVGDEGAALLPVHHRLDHRMAAAGDPQCRTVIDHRPGVAGFGGKFRKRRGDIEGGKGVGGKDDGLRPARHLARELVELPQLQRQCVVRRAADPALEFDELGGREPRRAGKGLTVDEEAVLTFRSLGGRQPVRLRRLDLDVIAENVVVADLQGPEIRFGRVTTLQIGDQPPAFVAQGARLVELYAKALRDEAPVAGRGRQLGGKRLAQELHEILVITEVLDARADRGRGRHQPVHLERGAQGGGLGEPVTDGGEVPGAAAAQRKA